MLILTQKLLQKLSSKSKSKKNSIIFKKMIMIVRNLFFKLIKMITILKIITMRIRVLMIPSTKTFAKFKLSGWQEREKNWLFLLALLPKLEKPAIKGVTM